MKPEFISRSPLETVEQLLARGRTNPAVEVLRQQQPAAAHDIIKQLLLKGRIDGPQAVSLISQSIPYDQWDELGIESIRDQP